MELSRLFSSPLAVFVVGVAVYAAFMPLYDADGVITFTGFLSLFGFAMCLALTAHAVAEVISGDEGEPSALPTFASA